MTTFSTNYKQLLSEFAGSAFDTEVGRYERLNDIFQVQVRLNPNRAAVRDGNRFFTYAELDAAANQLARWLLRRAESKALPSFSSIMYELKETEMQRQFISRNPANGS